MYKCYSLFIFIITCITGNAQLLKNVSNRSLPPLPLHAQHARQYAFSHFSTTNGLASNHVNNVIQDSKGFIWLATPTALQRYDGNRFLTFKNDPNNPQSLPDDNVALVYEDKRKNVWVVTADNKTGIFNTSTFTYTEVPIHNQPANSLYMGRKFIETSAGDLLLFMGAYGVYKYDIKENAFKRNDNLIPAPKGWIKNDTKYDSLTNRFWLGCDSGLVVFDPVKKHLNYRGHNIDNDLLISEFQSVTHAYTLHIDENRLVFCTWPPSSPEPVIYYFNKRTREKKTHKLWHEANLGYHEVISVISQQNGRLWIYGKPFIIEYTGNEPAFQLIRNEYKDEQSIKFDAAQNMYEDRKHNLWVSTNNGLYLFNPDAQLFNSYHLLRPDGTGAIEGPTQATLSVSNGQVWIGCWGIGLYCYDKNFIPVAVPAALRPFQNGCSIWSMVQHSSTGQIWFGMQAGEIMIYDAATGKKEKFYPPVFENRTIRQIAEDTQGNLWFGTQAGHIIKWDKKEAKDNPQTGYKLILKASLIHKLFIDKQGYLWAATKGQGLLKFNTENNQLIDYFKKDGAKGRQLWNDVVYDIVQYSDDTLLIAGGAINMINTRTKKITIISTEDGLPANNILCLQKDQNKILWLGSPNGLCRFNLKVGTFVMYDRRDGINYDIFEPACAYRLPGGKLVFNTDHNFLVFDPSQLVGSKIPPDVQLTDFKVGNQSLSTDSLSRLNRITLDYNKNSVVIEFSALNFFKKDKLHYHYRLENLEKEWKEGSDIGSVTYNYLPPGTYTFKVIAENADAVSSANMLTLQIKIKAPFWRSWWFYGFLVLLGAIVLYWIDKERIRQSFALQKIRSQIAGNLHEEVSTTLNNISLLSEMAKIKADRDIDRSKEYIDQINDKSRRMIDAMDDMLWSIDPENDSMKKTIDRMKEYAEGFQYSHGLTIDLKVEEKVEKLKLDMKTRHELFIIFKDALNCLAHTFKATSATINIDFEKSKLALKLQAGQLHATSKNVSKCAYLADINQRADKINALLDIQYDRKLTSVILQVPVES